MAQTDTGINTGLIKGLGLMDATTLVVGSMIGSGIFIVSADISRQVNSPGLLILTWATAMTLTLIAALSYGELAAAMPHAGGQYVYLREAFGPLSGFLYGWTLFMVIQTGTIAAVAVAFAKYTGIFIPWISAKNYFFGAGKLGLNTQQLLAVGILVLLTWINSRGIRAGALVQNIFTAAKVSALVALAIIGLLVGRNPQAITANFANFWVNSHFDWTTVRLVGVAMVGALFSADAWNNVTFTAGEVRNPRRNLPLSLAFGVGIVSILYLSTNFVYLNQLPLDAIKTAPEDRVATAAVSVLFGPIAVQIMAAAIMVSTFGCVNGMILSGARVYYTMAKDRLFFEGAGKLHQETHVPAHSLWMQCGWAVVLALSGQYSELLDYVIIAALLFYVLTIGGIFVLRRTQPNLERPYRAFGYPWLPAIYMVCSSLISVLLLVYKPAATVPGILIVLLGVPVYYFWRSRNNSVGRKS